MGTPEIKVFQIQHDEFQFLGIEYPLQNPDFGKIWENFDEMGGYDVVQKYHKSPYGIMVVWHNNNPEYNTYFVGTIVDKEKVDAIPAGYTLMKFPAREFLVVTHDWLPTLEEAVGEGNAQCGRYAENAPIPDGYVRYDGPGSQIVIIERQDFNDFCKSNDIGCRYEWWVPIKRVVH